VADSKPVDKVVGLPPGEGPPLTGGPFLVKVDRYGSVSGLVRVRVPLGRLVIRYVGPIESEESFGS